jgi:hypothetical protein
MTEQASLLLERRQMLLHLPLAELQTVPPDGAMCTS